MNIDKVELKTPSLKFACPLNVAFAFIKNTPRCPVPGINFQEYLSIFNRNNAKELSPRGVIVFWENGSFCQSTGNVFAFVT